VERFALTGAIVIPATYALAFAAYRLVELPGQRLGKAAIKRVVGRNTSRARQTVPETIAAP
jgi:peptidoglycan/LPS O-acetylase OafA/YrhL